MNFFTSLTDLALQRVYKFVLKRTLGQYLQSELLLDQLDVKSGEGMVYLRDLSLKCDLFREYLVNSPVSIESITLDELQATISYGALVDGLKLKCKNVNVNVLPTSKYQEHKQHVPENVGTRVDKTLHSTHFHINEKPVQPKNDDDDIGIEFVAQWIEIVISRLRVDVESVIINILKPSGTVALSVRLTELEFHNTHPKLIEADSLHASQSFTSNSFSVASLGQRKLLLIKGFTIGISDTSFGSDHIAEIFSMKDGLNLQINTIEDGVTDVDIGINGIDITMTPSTANDLADIVSVYISSAPSKENVNAPKNISQFAEECFNLETKLRDLFDNQTMRTLEDLKEEQKAVKPKPGDINLEMLPGLMEKYRLARMRIEMDNKKHELRDRTISEESTEFVDSDGEFPDDEDEFHDSNEKLSHSYRDALPNHMTSSQYGATSLSTAMYHTTVPNYSIMDVSKSSVLKKNKIGGQVRLHVNHVNCRFSDSNWDEKLDLSLEDFIFLIVSNSHKDKSHSAINCTILKIELTEIQGEDETQSVLLRFKNDSSIGEKVNILSSFEQPDLEVSSSNHNGKDELKINFGHMYSRISYTDIEKWSQRIIQLLPVQAESSSSFDCSIVLSIPSIEVNLVLINDGEGIDWKRYSNALALTANPQWVNKRWSLTTSTDPGIRVKLSNFTVNTQASNPLTISNFEGFLKLKVSKDNLIEPVYEVWETRFLRIASTQHADALLCRKASLALVGDIFATDSSSDSLMISLAEIKIDLMQSEFQLLYEVSNRILPSPNNKSQTSSSAKPTINLRLAVDTLIFCLSQDHSLVEHTNELSVSASKIGPLVYALVLRDCAIGFQQTGVLSDSNSDDGQTTSIYCSANDISMFEMPVSIYVLGGGKIPKNRGVRWWSNSEEYSAGVQIPFIHRTTLESSVDEFVRDANFEQRDDFAFLNAKDFKKSSVFELKLVISQQMVPHKLNENEFERTRNTDINISLTDMTYRFDPNSKWYIKLPELFNFSSPSPSPLVHRDLESSSDSLEMPYESPHTHADYSGSQTMGIFGVTNVSFRASKLKFDLCCGELYEDIHEKNSSFDQSRLLLSIGLLTLRTTLVSNATNIGLRLGIADVSLRLSNRISQNSDYEQSPMDINGESLNVSSVLDFDKFIDYHRFVVMASFDHLDCWVELNSPQHNINNTKSLMRIKFVWGNWLVIGCADSLRVLADSIAYIAKKFVISQPPKSSSDITRVPAKAVVLPDRLRTVDVDMYKPRKEVIVDDQLLQPSLPNLGSVDSNMSDITKLTVETSRDRPSVSQFAGLGNMIIEDYYGDDKKEDEVQDNVTQWLAHYDYDEESASVFSESNIIEEIEEDLSEGGSYPEQIEDDEDDSRSEESFAFQKKINNAPSGNNWSNWGPLQTIMLKKSEFNMELEDFTTNKNDESKSEYSESNVRQKFQPDDSDLESLAGDNNAEMMSHRSQASMMTALDAEYRDDDAEKAWEKEFSEGKNYVVEQQAGWYNSATGLRPDDIIPFYMTELPKTIEVPDESVFSDKRLPKIVLSIKFNIKIRFFDGSDWTIDETKSDSKVGEKEIFLESKAIVEPGELFDDHDIFNEYSKPKLFTAQQQSRRPKNPALKPKQKQLTLNKIDARGKGRQNGDMIELSCDNSILTIADYVHNAAENIENRPSHSIFLSIFDALVCHAPPQRKKKKIIGYWKNVSVPREIDAPFVKVLIHGYDIFSRNDSKIWTEYRTTLELQPVRCYLDGHLIEFIRRFASSLALVSSNSVVVDLPEKSEENLSEGQDSPLKPTTTPDLIYFQSWNIKPILLKIDYMPKQVNFNAIQHGDFVEMLNLISIHGMEITLADVNFTGVSGLSAAFSKSVNIWCSEIYANQIHSIVTGTFPFKGLATIGTQLKGVFFVPAKEYKKHGIAGVLKSLQRQSKNLMKTVTRETLNAAHQVSMLVANTLVDLVSGSDESSPMTRNSRIENRQPVGFVDSLDKAYDAVSREFNSTVDTVVAIPVKQYRRSGPGGAIRSFIRAIPVAVLRPVAGAAEALSYTLLGIRNNLDPQSRKDEEDMWNVDHDIHQKGADGGIHGKQGLREGKSVSSQHYKSKQHQPKRNSRGAKK